MVSRKDDKLLEQREVFLEYSQDTNPGETNNINQKQKKCKSIYFTKTYSCKICWLINIDPDVTKYLKKIYFLMF